MSFAAVTLKLLEGFQTTVLLFALTLVMALPLGLCICALSRTSIAPVRWITRLFIWIIRGTPLMLQIFVIFYGPGLLFGIQVGPDYRFQASVIAFVINYSAYFSEIYRGGLESIPQGQYEAGQVLGLTKTQTFFRVVLMQVVKRIVPPMSNEIITLVKDTSLVRIIAVTEIIKNAEYFAKNNGLIWPLFYTGAFYLLFSGLLTLLFRFIENKLGYYKIT